MDQKLLIDAVGKHLDALASLLGWAFATAFAMTYAGLAGQETLEVVGLKIKRNSAYYVAALLTIVALIGILLSMMRLLTLMSLLDDEHFMEGFTRLTSHEWFLNPFSFFGGALLAQLHSSISYFLFFMIVGFLSLPLGQLPFTGSRSRLVVAGVTAATGVAIAVTVWRVNMIIINRSSVINTDLYSALVLMLRNKTTSLMFCMMAFTLVGRALSKWRAADR